MMMSMQSSGILASSSDEEGPQTIPVSGELQLATLIKKMSLDPTGSDSAFPLDSVGNRIVPKEYFRGCKDMVMTNVKNRQSGQMVPGVDVVSVIQAFEGKDRHGAAQTWNKWINEDIKKTIQADICLGKYRIMTKVGDHVRTAQVECVSFVMGLPLLIVHLQGPVANGLKECMAEITSHFIVGSKQLEEVIVANRVCHTGVPTMMGEVVAMHEKNNGLTTFSSFTNTKPVDDFIYEETVIPPPISYVYGMSSPSFQGIIKIGRSQNPTKREAESSVFNPCEDFKIVCSAQTLNDVRDEKMIHDILKSKGRHHKGEFYRVSREELQLLFVEHIEKKFHQELGGWKESTKYKELKEREDGLKQLRKEGGLVFWGKMARLHSLAVADLDQVNKKARYETSPSISSTSPKQDTINNTKALPPLDDFESWEGHPLVGCIATLFKEEMHTTLEQVKKDMDARLEQVKEDKKSALEDMHEILERHNQMLEKRGLYIQTLEEKMSQLEEEYKEKIAKLDRDHKEEINFLCREHEEEIATLKETHRRELQQGGLAPL